MKRSPLRVAVVGASANPARYSFKAIRMLAEYGHEVVCVNPAFDEILEHACLPVIAQLPRPVHTMTLYVGAARSTPMIPDILTIHPNRIIMNPGAENDELERQAAAEEIEVMHGCTLIMLQTGEF